jgi:phage terminase small subunit
MAIKAGTTISKLTLKQEAFAQAYIETGNASEAYRRAYDSKNMKPESIHRKAKELLDNGKVSARLDALKADAAKRNEVNVDSIIAELELARKLAMENMNPSAAVAAILAKAKVCGLDKLTLEHTGKNGGPLESMIIQVKFVEPGEYGAATA